MIDSLVTDPRAAVRVLDALMLMCLLAAVLFGMFDRHRNVPPARLRASHRSVIFAGGWLMALIGAVIWTTMWQRPLIVFVATLLLCWTWTVVLCWCREWTGAAVGIALWGGVLAAAGALRILVSVLLLTSFGFVLIAYHRNGPRNSPEA